MPDETNEYGEYETPTDVANRPSTSFGPHSDRTVSDIRFALVEGFRPLRLDLHLPRDASAPFPVVVSIHGGGWLLGSNKIDSDDTVSIAALWESLLANGIAVASVQYRLSGEAPFPAQLHDVKAAVRWLRAFGGEFGIDSGRIAAFGDSAGAHLALLLAVTGGMPELEGAVGVRDGASDIVSAVSWYGPTELESLSSEIYDWWTDDSMASRLLGADFRTSLDLARAASPITYVSASSAPILLQHGELDDLVPYQQAPLLAERYRSFAVEAEAQVIPDAGHGFGEPELAPIVASAVQFFERHFAAAVRSER